MLRKPALARYTREILMVEADRAASHRVTSESNVQAPTTADQARRAKGICFARSQAAYHQITGSQESSKTRARQIHSLTPARKVRCCYSILIPVARLSPRRFLQPLPTRHQEIHSRLSWTHLELHRHGPKYRLTIINVL
jgi:hypothetical protein